jgi:hypothetical protein
MKVVVVARHGYCQRYPFRDSEQGCENSLVRRWRMKRGLSQRTQEHTKIRVVWAAGV